MSISQICRFIASVKSIIPQNRVITSFTDLKESVLMQELAAEINYLEKELNSTETLKAAIKKRCREREEDKDNCISFSNRPNSVTNDFYWALINKLFVPKTMREMLEIILPGIKEQLTIDFRVLKPRLDGLEIILTKERLNDLQSTVQIEELSHYVTANGLLFDVRDISRYPLDLHKQFFHLLHEKYPLIAASLYEHNLSLNNLKADILFIEGKGRTPKEAIEQLIKGLRLGGTAITGKSDATECAQVAYLFFLEYFKYLLPETQRALKKFSNGSLDKILLDLQAGNCVETAANNLQKFLQINKNNLLLNTPLTASPEFIKALKKRYPTQLGTKKDNDFTFNLPWNLVSKKLASITPSHFEELAILFLEIPISHYNDLWLKINLIQLEPSLLLAELKEAFNSNFFSPEQRRALTKAICRTYQRFDKNTLLLFAAELQHPEFMQEVCVLYTTEELLVAVREKDKNGKTVLHKVTASPAALKILIGALPLDNLLAEVQVRDHTGKTVLHWAAINNLESLIVVLALWPESNQITAMEEKDQGGKTVVHWAVKKPKILEAVLALWPPEKRIEVVRKEDNLAQSVLHLAAVIPKSILALLKLLPETDRAEAIQDTDQNGKMVLDHLVTFPGLLEEVQFLLPKDPKTDSNRVLFSFFNKSKSLTNSTLGVLLASIPF